VGRAFEEIMPLIMKKRKSRETTRITLDLSKDFYNRLQQLEMLVDVSSKSEVIREALRLYEFMANKTAAGFTFRLVSPDKTEEKDLLFFDLPNPESN